MKRKCNDWFVVGILLMTNAGCHRAPPAALPVVVTPGMATPTIAAPLSATPALKFELSDSAANKVKELLATYTEKPVLVVWVDFDNEKFCTGFHYNLTFEERPDLARFTMLASQGIKIAVDTGDARFLDGTTLDFATLQSGTAGFVFRNPNEKVSMVPELQDQQ